MIEVENLTIGPGVLADFAMRVPPGQIMGLVGRSGSGKTAVAHALLGHMRPGLRLEAGSVRIDGQDPFTTPALRGRVVSYLGQDPASALHPARRIGSLLAETVKVRGVPATEIPRLLGLVQVPSDKAFLRRYPHQISGGQAQRVALAIALAGAPRVLVLDEPTSGADAVLASDLVRLLADVCANPAMATVLISHDRAVVAALASESIELDRGRIVRTGRPVAPEPIVVPKPVPSSRPRLVVDGLSVRTLKGVSLTVNEGQCVALVGKSGAGKTTLASCLVGLLKPDRGEIRLDGKRPQLVAQDSVAALNPKETVRAAIARVTKADLEPLLDRVRLPMTVADRLPSQLSGGERQRVNLARALAAEPTVLVCDEITSALDHDTTVAVLELLAELRADLGLSVLLITHDTAVAEAAADDVLVLSDGVVRRRLDHVQSA
ncbi:ABC transporter ATP-binding protein [Kibdelosporangium aridum]|uniref:Peptide/nickel transport system ATP-binding protein n=1 Tax=Kibdelosporangium aridum TaxID=2030 RepID=A0A1Y5X658_KIBAR|nr:ATP-binding cassette domain-containing protein [Kibdelosporangium aridum]SMC73715.1 peptide/nickel transport system ATP-binding protein [Kibdelosporangium aridum]